MTAPSPKCRRQGQSVALIPKQRLDNALILSFFLTGVLRGLKKLYFGFVLGCVDVPIYT